MPLRLLKEGNQVMIDKIFLYTYGFFLIVGAYFGWKAGSKVSLIMGLTAGLLVLLSVFIMGGNPKTGYLFLAVIGGMLSAVFLMRLVQTHKIMPSVPLLVVSFAVFLLCAYRLMK